jgi:hypothetical protein
MKPDYQARQVKIFIKPTSFFRPIACDIAAAIVWEGQDTFRQGEQKRKH